MNFRRARHNDVVLLVCVALLTIIGLAMLTSASAPIGAARFGDPYYYIKHQVYYGLSAGLVGFFFTYFLPYRWYAKIALPILLVTLALLFLLFTPFGLHLKGATRWIEIGSASFQPSEFLKIAFLLYLAAWLKKGKDRALFAINGFWPFALVTGAVALILLIQKSTSSAAILVGTALVVYFASGARLKYIAALIALGGFLFAIVIYITPYRFNRVLVFLKPDSATLEGARYHSDQALVALQSGGLTGLGYGQSIAKLRRLPEVIGDSIFAVIGEEFGFVGASIVIGLFALLVIRILLIARRAPDRFGELLLIGFATLIALQVFIHIGAISGIIPLTGAPLPFISYGGTSLAVMLTISGIIANVARYTR